MSKAFVIKNKDGKYLYEGGYLEFGEKLGYAHTEVEKEPLEKLIKYCKNIIGDCEIVEITITEDDLEQKIAVLERALKNTCRLLYGTYDEHYPNCFIKQAEKELKEMGQ